jgi:hypothetical protein
VLPIMTSGLDDPQLPDGKRKATLSFLGRFRMASKRYRTRAA